MKQIGHRSARRLIEISHVFFLCSYIVNQAANTNDCEEDFLEKSQQKNALQYFFEIKDLFIRNFNFIKFII